MKKLETLETMEVLSVMAIIIAIALFAVSHKVEGGIKTEQAIIEEPSSSHDPLSEWNIYQNDKWGYSLEYPGDWQVKTVLTNFNKPEHVVKELVAFKSPDEIPMILVDLWTNVSQSSLLDWFIKIQKPILSEGVALPDGANTEVSGFPAIEIENPQSHACDEFVTLFLAKEEQLVFRFTYRVCDDFETMPIYKNMLSTFKVK